MDPALKGTTFGAALEAAERDEQAKREARAAELSKTSVGQKARLIAEALREAPFSFINTQSTETPPMTDIPSMTDTPTPSYSDAQVKILAMGMQGPFRLGPGTAARRLFDDKLIERGAGGQCAITHQGRVTYMMITKGFAPTPHDTEATPAMTTASHPYSEAQLNILRLGLEASNARVPHGTVTKRLFDDGLIVRTTDGHYKTTDKGRATWTALAASPKPSPSAPPSAASEETPSPSKLPLTPVEIEATSPQNKQPQQIESAPQLTAVDQTATTGINWYQSVIAPLIDLMLTDGSIAISADDPLNDPSSIVRYVTITRQSWRDACQIADERAQIIEERDSKIESLNRCVEELEGKLKVWQQEYNAVKRHDLAVIILDDLCHLIPEVEAYRVGREDADRALEALKARR